MLGAKRCYILLVRLGGDGREVLGPLKLARDRGPEQESPLLLQNHIFIAEVVSTDPSVRAGLPSTFASNCTKPLCAQDLRFGKHVTPFVGAPRNATEDRHERKGKERPEGTCETKLQSLLFSIQLNSMRICNSESLLVR